MSNGNPNRIIIKIVWNPLKGNTINKNFIWRLWILIILCIPSKFGMVVMLPLFFIRFDVGFQLINWHVKARKPIIHTIPCIARIFRFWFVLDYVLFGYFFQLDWLLILFAVCRICAAPLFWNQNKKYIRIDKMILLSDYARFFNSISNVLRFFGFSFDLISCVCLWLWQMNLSENWKWQQWRIINRLPFRASIISHFFEPICVLFYFLVLFFLTDHFKRNRIVNRKAKYQRHVNVCKKVDF